MRVAILIILLGVTYATTRESFDPESDVFILDDKNFENTTHIGSKEYFNIIESEHFQKPWFIMFYAMWCPHCKRIIGLWEEVAAKYKD